METKDIRKINLIALLQRYEREKGLTQDKFAELCGTSAPTISQIVGGKGVRNLGAKLARKIENSLNLPRGWMDSLHNEEIGQEAARGLDEINNAIYVKSHTPGKKYPLLSMISAGAWTEALEPYTLKEVDLWLESDAHTQGEAFWLQVEGDSMTAPMGVSIPEGTYVLFDTGREAVNGSLVVAKLDDDNEATFKKLIIDGGRRFLRGLNPAWPLLPINGNCRIIGVAIETKMRLV